MLRKLHVHVCHNRMNPFYDTHVHETCSQTEWSDSTRLNYSNINTSTSTNTNTILSQFSFRPTHKTCILYMAVEVEVAASTKKKNGTSLRFPHLFIFVNMNTLFKLY